MSSRINKEYLSPELIQEVLRQANDIVWRMGIWGKFTRNWYDVFTISPAGLIHIAGNEDTGWKHIMERHGYFSNASYFGDGALGNPNKFTRDSMPGEDFRNVADDVYLQQQKDTKPHPDEQLFEKYKGMSSRYTGSDGSAREFHLVLYKETRIVHSIYPTKNLEGKLPKRVLPTLARDKANIKATTRPIDDYYLITIPYHDKELVTRYVIIFKLDKATLMAKGYIQLNSLGGMPVQTTYPHLVHFKINTVLPPTPFSDAPIEFVRFMNGLTLADLSKLEKVIAKIEADLQTYFDSLRLDKPPV